MIARHDRPLWDAMHQPLDVWCGEVCAGWLNDDHRIAAWRSGTIKDTYYAGSGPVGGFTCDGCPAAAYCTCAFDSYNTDGDCLAMK